MQNLPLLVLTVAAICGCTSVTVPPIPTVKDHHSRAEPTAVQVTHLDLDLTLDFEARVVRGIVKASFVRHQESAPLILDTDGLQIDGVKGRDGAERSFQLGVPHKLLGSALTIDLLPDDRMVEIAYRTSSNAAALQWLGPEQTDTGAGPFLFTQGQAILTRSWIPCQDTPGVRITFDARIRAPKPLTVVMAAEGHGVDPDGAFRFRMQKPMPSYLLALACGHLTTRDISSRCRVVAEPTVIERAADELVDLERLVTACEQLFGPYRFGRFDVLILPPSFPFGGMENPMLTFATPTILAGDRSLVALIAHELAHSWSGNLVTNATWRDFWLNEGFTVYLEHRIMEAVYGRERAEMEIVLGLQGLKKELQELKPGDQVLHIDLTDRNPDDGMTAVAYDKGATFLHMLEQHFGRKRFDRFLSEWFDRHAFQSMTTAQFDRFLMERLLDGDLELRATLKIDPWLRSPGLPANAPEPHSEALARADAVRKAFLAGTPPTQLPVEGFVFHQWLHFLNGLPATITAAQMAALDQAFQFTGSGNHEILAAWLVLSIRHGHTAADQRLEQFLMTVGRRKFVQPLFEELAKTEDGLKRARRIYQQARPRYHTITTRTIDA